MAFWSALYSRSARTAPVIRPSLTLFFLLVGAFLLTLVPHVVQFPIWVSIGIVVAMMLRSTIEVYRLPLPSSAFCGFLALVLLGLIMVQYGGNVMGRDPGTALTAGLLAIKFYELRRPRDIALIIFSCFFVVMSALLYSQVLELFIYCLIMMWVLTALLLRVHTGDLPHDRLLQMLEKSGVIFLQALPLAFFLFFFFPRYPGPLGINLEEASIGLNDKVSPGSIARLSQNDSEAMYVQFSNANVPLTSTMYWRALVLWDYENGAWIPGSFAATGVRFKPSAAPGSPKYTQQITVKAHNQKWLFALDSPISAAEETVELPASTVMAGDVLQLTMGKLDHMARYNVTSATTLADEAISPFERDVVSVQLPNSLNDHIDPEVKNLADQLHQGLSADQEQEYVNRVIHYFRHGGFQYSAIPGIQGPDWLPTFLFKTKTGFCEHFASAFAILMRIEKVPARLIVGYSGADYNPYTDLYVVSQSNAHAWDEVWIKAQAQPTTGKYEVGHWVREDPTALIAAGEGLPANNNSAESGDTLSIQVAHHQMTFSEAHMPALLRSALKEMQLRREQVETNWDDLILSYDPDAQSRLVQALGFGEKAQTKMLLACLVAAGICFIFFKKWMARKTLVSPVENLYSSFCRNMAQRGVPRAAWEGPLSYTERVAEAFPEDKLAIQRVGFLVAHVRYAPAPPDFAADHLKLLLTRLTASQAATSSRERR
jgi:transglutaminase-like putative cysteine protease